jgi:hypothetical protein
MTASRRETYFESYFYVSGSVIIFLLLPDIKVLAIESGQQI